MSRKRTLLVGWTLAIALSAGFAGLGLWQSRRADEKQAMLDASAQVLATRTIRPLAAAADVQRAREYDWAGGHGEFDARGPLLLDNQQRNGRAGVQVYRIFRPDAGPPLLIDLGWLPLAGDRRLPAVPRPPGRLELHGLLAPPPATGLALGPALARDGEAWLMPRIDLAAIARETGLERALAPRVLRLDPDLPIGYERDLQLLGNTLSPERHRGYAVQWFALALAVLVTALVLTLRRPRTSH